MHIMCKNWVMCNTQIQHLWWIYFTKSKIFLYSREFLENSREISLLDLDLEAFSFHCSLLEKSESDFHLTFHFSEKVNQIFNSLFTSRKERIRFSDSDLRGRGVTIKTLQYYIGEFQVKGTDLWGVGFKSVFLALLRPFRGDFRSWVDFGALWGSNFWNIQMDPLFLILLLILHLNSWKRYTFDISGPKWAQNSQNRLKMAKIRYSHMAIFWKKHHLWFVSKWPKI